jgi:hypothetical protein
MASRLSHIAVRKSRNFSGDAVDWRGDRSLSSTHSMQKTERTVYGTHSITTVRTRPPRRRPATLPVTIRTKKFGFFQILGSISSPHFSYWSRSAQCT